MILVGSDHGRSQIVRVTTNPTGFAVSMAPPELIDAWLRMMRLIDQPNEAPILAAMIERETLFRVLMGPQGDKLREVACADSPLAQGRPAIDWIRRSHSSGAAGRHWRV